MLEEEIYCESCGRYVGPYERCPYCSAEIKKRLSIKILKYGSVILSIGGLILLYLITRHIQLPTLKINEITDLMNFAYIRVKGTVSREPIFDEKSKILTYRITDGTGELTIKAYSVIATTLKEKKAIPSMGDFVDLEGTVRIRGQAKFLTINIPDRVKISKPVPISVPLASITDKQLKKIITTTGIVVSFKKYKTYTKIFITDEKFKNRIRVSMRFTEGLPVLKIGQRISVTGMLDYYKGFYQIFPASPANIRIVSDIKSSDLPFIRRLKISQITESMIDEPVKVEGRIESIRHFSKGVALLISDNGSKIEIIIWEDVYLRLKNKQLLSPNNKLKVIGVVGVYRKKLQIELVNPDDIEIIYD